MDMTTFDNVTAWAQAQWGTAALGDRRRTARAVRLGAAVAADPQASLPTQTARWGDLKAAYRLLNEPDVTHAALSTPHWEQTRADAATTEGGPVLFIQDTTELDYTPHRHTAGLGPIGDGRGRGFEVQSCLAVQPTGGPPQVLGLAYQQPWARPPVHPPQETRGQRWARERESAVWGHVLTAIGRPPGRRHLGHAQRQGLRCLCLPAGGPDAGLALLAPPVSGSRRPRRGGHAHASAPLAADGARASRAGGGVARARRGSQAQRGAAGGLGAGADLCAAQRAGAAGGARGRLGSALLGRGVGVAPLYHAAHPRCRDGPVVRALVRAALAGGRVS